jgi:hypothetical protein
VGLILALPILNLIWGEGRRRRRRVGAAGDNVPFQLPSALDYLRIFRKGYALSFVCGKIKSRKSSGSGSLAQDYSGGSDGTSSAPRQSSLDYEIETPDGSIAKLHFLIVRLHGPAHSLKVSSR